MGGSIKVAVRFSDETVYAEVRHTNALPYWIRHPKFIDGDETWFRKYTETKSEYNEGDTTFAPVSYGVVVIDFLKRTVYVANNYSRLEDTAILDSEMMKSRLGLDGEEEVVFREMLDRQLLSLIQYPRKKGRDAPIMRIPLVDVTPENWNEKVVQFTKDQEEQGVFFFSMAVNFPGWTFKHYEEEREGEHRRMRDDLREAGFVLTEEDDKRFEQWRRDRSDHA